MDRRRFVPSAEGLEGRALLASSVFNFSKPNKNPTDTVPMTFSLKEHRIERLPHYLEQIRSGRYLSEETIHKLQADLLAVTTRMHAPKTAILEGYNSRLRDVNSHTSLSVDNAKLLNQAFENVIKSAGANPEAVANLTDDLNAMAKVDANSPQPMFLATNDYTLVLQTILGIGRPIRRPESPQLAAGNGVRVGRSFGVSAKDQPTVVGNYDPYAEVQIVDATGAVVGSSFVKKNGEPVVNGEAQPNGKYAITFTNPLPNGLYTFTLRTIDQYGNMSHPSPPFKIKINTDLVHNSGAVPAGPLAVK